MSPMGSPFFVQEIRGGRLSEGTLVKDKRWLEWTVPAVSQVNSFRRIRLTKWQIGYTNVYGFLGRNATDHTHEYRQLNQVRPEEPRWI